MIKTRILTLALFAISISRIYAQVPQAFKYQGVARDAAGLVLNAQAITVRLSIHDVISTGSVIYQESHVVTTSAFGLFNVNMGQGVVLSGNFTAINWGLNNKYIEQEVDFGSGFVNMGTSQFLSVPYALYSGNNSSSNIYGSGAGIAITGSVISNTAPDQTVNILPGLNTAVSGIYPSFTVDATPSLSISGNQLSISNGNTIMLPSSSSPYTAGSGISIASGSIINTSPNITPSVAVTTTAAATASVASSGSSFNINVPPPTFTNSGPATITGAYPNYTINSAAGTTYTNGTGISITSGSIINISPNITPTVAVTTTAAAAASVSSSGSSFNINVPAPTFTNSGPATITGAYPNFTINSSAATTYTNGTGISITSGSIINTSPNITPTVAVTTTAAAAASVSSSGSSFNINVPAPTFTNSGPATITGAYPNFTINSAAATTYTNGAGISITSGSIITNTSPGITPTIAVTTSVAPSPSVSNTGNAFNINVPAPTFTNSGPTTITGSYPNFTVNSSSTSGWGTTGNAGTTPATNYIGTSDAQSLVIKTNAVERLRVLANGDVAIGSQTAGINAGAGRYLTVSSTTAYANSSAALELEGGSLSTLLPVAKIDFNSAIGSNPSANIVRIAALRAGSATAGVLQLSTHDGTSMLERMRIAENGNASIGSTSTFSARLNLFATTTDTSTPVGLSVTNNYTGASNKFGIDVNVDGAGSAAKFGVSSTVVGLAGDGNANYAFNAAMTPNGSGTIYGNNTTINGAGSGIRYGNYTSVTSLAANNSNIYGHRILMSGTNATALKYGLYVSGEDMNYFANSVGIGTATPIYKLVVAGPQANAIDGPNMSFVTTQDNYPTMHLFNWNHSEQYMMFNAYYDGAYRSSSTAGNFKLGGYNGKLIFQAAGGYAAGTNMNSNFIDAMMIGNNGYVGIGINSSTTQPSYPFHVNKADAGVLTYIDNNTQSSGTGLRTEVITTATTTGNRYGLYSQAANGQSVNYGAFSHAHGGQQSFGLWTESGGQSTVWNMGLYSAATGTNGVYAAYMIGNVWVGGTLSKSAGTFKIDHPQDPENKFLIHSFVESPDMMNVYNGNITTDANGDAIVQLPSYFEAENINFRYQLTVMGQFAQAIVLEEVANNQFKVKTDKPNVKVSWQVTGVRNDEYAKKNRVVPEVDKKGAEIGNYLAPEAYGFDESRRIGPKREMPDNTRK